MRYQIKYLRRCKEEADHYRSTYGVAFAVSFDEWLIEIATSAANDDLSTFVDITEAMQERAGPGPFKSNWQRFCDRFRRAGGWERIQILLEAVRRRGWPLRLVMTDRWLHLLDHIPTASAH